ncbi:choloylglycine hydrolase [hydrocarbon metagenome]|uniref:Choloylglycine hydrolase n=1 Tax=hydrocarbon metagenome TaxID=938273 RepID=A0A0W8FKY6_9ZZZZ
MKKIIVAALAVCFAFQGSALACTNFILKAKDNAVVNGRSMEFPIDLKSEIVIFPAGIYVENKDAKGNPGILFTTKYGFLGINAFGIKDTFVDGFNEQGLSLSALMYTGAKYQPAVPGKFMNLENFSTWVLGSFSTVDEVKSAMSGIYVSGGIIKKLKDMGLHVAIADISGKSIVIEFIDGKTNIYDNPLGVMTNRPSFDWHMTNLRNYVHLDRNDRKPKTISGVKIEPTGVGSGMVGIPGDWTPPSRFVRIVIAKDAALKPKNTEEAVNLSEHLLNIVDIPKGVIKEHPAPLVTIYGFAQWVITKDMTNRVLYFKTYDNTSWKTVDLKKFDMKPGSAKKYLSIDATRPSIPDVSEMLK